MVGRDRRGALEGARINFDHEGEPVAGSVARALARCNVCSSRADVAQLVEQRFRKPQVTGSNPVVGSSLRSQQRGSESCHAVASAQADRLIPSNFLLRATAWQALDSELLESDD